MEVLATLEDLHLQFEAMNTYREEFDVESGDLFPVKGAEYEKVCFSEKQEFYMATLKRMGTTTYS